MAYRAIIHLDKPMNGSPSLGGYIPVSSVGTSALWSGTNAFFEDLARMDIAKNDWLAFHTDIGVIVVPKANIVAIEVVEADDA